MLLPPSRKQFRLGLKPIGLSEELPDGANRSPMIGQQRIDQLGLGQAVKEAFEIAIEADSKQSEDQPAKDKPPDQQPEYRFLEETTAIHGPPLPEPATKEGKASPDQNRQQ